MIKQLVNILKLQHRKANIMKNYSTLIDER